MGERNKELHLERMILLKFLLRKVVLACAVLLATVTLHTQEVGATEAKHEATYRFLYGEASSKELKAYCEEGVRKYRSDYYEYMPEPLHKCTGTEDNPPTFVLGNRNIVEREVVWNDDYMYADYRIYPLPDIDEKVKVYYELYPRVYRETFDFVDFSPFQ